MCGCGLFGYCSSPRVGTDQSSATAAGKPYNEVDGKSTRQPGSTISHEVERRKDVVHFEAEVVHKASDAKIIAQAIAEKSSGKDIAKTVFVPVTAKAKLDMTIEPIIERIVEGIGDREQAMRWLGTPVRALDFATPISMLGTKEGVEKVMDVLGQMEHGVW